MRGSGRCDQNRIDLVRREYLFGATSGGNTLRQGDTLRRLAVHVKDCDQFRAGMPRYVGGMHLADTATSKNGNT
jgi:hypothetical protein